MELFLGDPDSALGFFNGAYAAVIQHCRRLGPGEDGRFLQSVRWTCDVIAFKIVWILMSQGDRLDADEYFAGHVAWFTGSHATEDEQALVTWKCQLYEGMSQLARAATAQTKVEKEDGPTRERSAGYYAYLAARNAISLQTLLPDQGPTLATDKVLPLLALAYDQPKHHHRMTLQLGRLISSQYLLLGGLNEAKAYSREEKRE